MTLLFYCDIAVISKYYSKSARFVLGISALIYVLLLLPITALAEPYVDGYEALNDGDYAKAISIWIAAANDGDHDSMGALRNLYEEGSEGWDDIPDFQPDPALAEYWRQREKNAYVGVKAAEDSFFNGVEAYNKGDFLTAAKEFSVSANDGNDFAMDALAHMYELGKGVPQSDELAFFWAIQAANAGNIIASSRLGLYYYQGLLVEKSFPKARDLFRYAADRGNISAMKNLGYMYADGEAVVQSNSLAFKYFKQAKDAGSEEGAQVYAAFQEHVADYKRRIDEVAAKNREIDSYNARVKASNDRIRQQRALQKQYSYDRNAAHNYWANWKPSYCSAYISTSNTTTRGECAN